MIIPANLFRLKFQSYGQYDTENQKSEHYRWNDSEFKIHWIAGQKTVIETSGRLHVHNPGRQITQFLNTENPQPE